MSPHDHPPAVSDDPPPAASPSPLAGLKAQLTCYLAALWGHRVTIAGGKSPQDPGQPRRSTFHGAAIRLPEEYRGFSGSAAVDLYHAAAAHIGAHLAYGGARFPQRSLNPVQVALVSSIEDARVERLALRDYPGLRRLWLPYHVAEPSDLATAPGLLARLARALVDDAYDDPHAWVRKGRRLFQNALGRLGDSAVSREIGGLLGNDLGQMRVQFNARTFTVEPVYRDDNLGVWELPETASDPTEVDISVPRSAGNRREESSSWQPPSVAQLAKSGDAASQGGTALPQAFCVAVVEYPEWDYAIGQERPAWTTLRELEPVPVPAAEGSLSPQDRSAVRRLRVALARATLDRPAAPRQEVDGDLFHLDAALRAHIERAVGLLPDPRVYAKPQRRRRSLSTLVLLDASESTKDPVRGTEERVFDLQRRAVSLFAETLGHMDDVFAVRAFCSSGRGDVRYWRIKDFDQPFAPDAPGRLAAIQPGWSTRLGAAIRHADHELLGTRSQLRLLLLISDGEASDIDVPPGTYLAEDARHAIWRLRQQGVLTICFNFQSGADSQLARVFGARHLVRLRQVARLPFELSRLYTQLTA